jgi:EAL domain-containing protein (putative c-di-GMP-specific phosphodiesterase class I)
MGLPPPSVAGTVAGLAQSLKESREHAGEGTLRAGPACRRLRRLGVRHAINDVGAGSSAKSYPRECTVDTLKMTIDRSFVHGVARNGHATVIVRGRPLSHALGMRGAAEGGGDAGATGAGAD